MSAGVIDIHAVATNQAIDLLCAILNDKPDSDYAFQFRGKAFSYFTNTDGKHAPDGYEVTLCEIDRMPGDEELTNGNVVSDVGVFWGGEDGYLMMGLPERKGLSNEALILRAAFTTHIMEGDTDA